MVNELDALIFLRDTLIAAGFVCELDQQKLQQPKPPFVLIELDRAEPIEWDATGIPTNTVYSVTVSCMVSAQGRDFMDYKRDAIDYARATMTALHANEHVAVREKASAYDEALIGSLKCSGAAIEIDLQFNFS